KLRRNGETARPINEAPRLAGCRRRCQSLCEVKHKPGVEAKHLFPETVDESIAALVLHREKTFVKLGPRIICERNSGTENDLAACVNETELSISNKPE